ncbi:MAG: hypothetical protein ACTTKP_10545 [Catonella sp.]
MAGNDIIKLYMNATPAKRVNIIITHYTDIVDGYCRRAKHYL